MKGVFALMQVSVPAFIVACRKLRRWEREQIIKT